MKTLNKIKLNNLSAENLSEKQMKEIKGGNACTSLCNFENYGGSSTSDNCLANYKVNGWSYTYSGYGDGTLFHCDDNG